MEGNNTRNWIGYILLLLVLGAFIFIRTRPVSNKNEQLIKHFDSVYQVREHRTDSILASVAIDTSAIHRIATRLYSIPVVINKIKVEHDKKILSIIALSDSEQVEFFSTWTKESF